MTDPSTPRRSAPDAVPDAVSDDVSDTVPADVVDDPQDGAAPQPAAEPAPEVVAPPLTWLVAYRMLGLRLPPEYNGWVARDVKAKRFVTWRGGRTLLWLLVLIGLAFLGYRLGRGQWLGRRTLIQAALIASAVALFSSRDSLVRRTLRWQRIDKHGRPAKKVKKLGLLGNREVVALGLLASILWVAGAYVLGYGNKPTGLAAAPCREAERGVMDRIRAKQTKKDHTYATTRMIVVNERAVVLALTQPPGAPSKDNPPFLELWIVTPDSVSRLGNDDKASTNHPVVTEPDSGLNPVIQRLANCMSQKPVR